MGRVKTFVNGGSLLPSDLDSIEDDYELSFRAYREVTSASNRLDAATASTRLLASGITPAVAVGTATDGLAAYYIDPARWDATVPVADPRSVYYNLVFSTITNGTAPAITLTAGLYPVATAAGAAANVNLTLGAVVAGSTAASASAQALDTLAEISSGDFAAPAAGFYAIAVVVATGGMAANSSVAVRATLLTCRY